MISSCGPLLTSFGEIRWRRGRGWVHKVATVLVVVVTPVINIVVVVEAYVDVQVVVMRLLGRRRQRAPPAVTPMAGVD